MLILTRRLGETLIIGDDVNVTVLGVKGNQVRLGVNAPRDIEVHREEIYLKIQQERLQKIDKESAKLSGNELIKALIKKYPCANDNNVSQQAK